MTYKMMKQQLEVLIHEAYEAGITPVAEDLEAALETLEFAQRNNLIR